MRRLGTITLCSLIILQLIASPLFHANALQSPTNGNLLVNQNGYLELLNPETGDSIVLANPYADGGQLGDFGISPNGQVVAYEYSYYNFFNNSYDPPFLRLAAVDGSWQYDLDVQVAWHFSFSPDGSALAYSGYNDRTGQYELDVLDFSNGNIYTLANSTNPNPSWSPDGNVIAYAKNMNLYLYDLNDGTSRQVTTDNQAGSPTGWSPDGNQLLVLRNQKLFFLNISTGLSTDFDPTNKYEDITGASLSPDGTKTSIMTYSSRSHLYVIDGTTSTDQTLEIPTVDLRSGVYWQSNMDTKNVYRFWSPDHRHHFFTADYLEALTVMLNYPDNTWTYEGVAFQESTSETCTNGEVPVYRFWSDTLMGHFFTADSAERDYIITHYPTNIWHYEGQSFCSVSQELPGATPVYRFWSDLYHSHFYTTDLTERDNIIAHYPTSTWHYEGIAYYAL